MASKKILDFNSQRFGGLTGTNDVLFRPFDFSTYGLTSVTRAIIEYDCVALATVDTGNTYNDAYSGRMIYTFYPAGPSGALVANYNSFNPGTQTNWSASAVTSPYGIEIACVGQATTKTFTVFCAARIVAFVNND